MKRGLFLQNAWLNLTFHLVLVSCLPQVSLAEPPVVTPKTAKDTVAEFLAEVEEQDSLVPLVNYFDLEGTLAQMTPDQRATLPTPDIAGFRQAFESLMRNPSTIGKYSGSESEEDRRSAEGAFQTAVNTFLNTKQRVVGESCESPERCVVNIEIQFQNQKIAAPISTVRTKGSHWRINSLDWISRGMFAMHPPEVSGE